VGILSYIAIVVVIRVSGKRTLSSMNAFDFIVTVALGSMLATVLLSEDVDLVEGEAGFIVLIGLQFIVSFATARSKAVGRYVKNTPRLLYFRGDLLHEALTMERISTAEILQALRSQGISSFDEVEAVILETNGSLSTIRQVTSGERSTLSNVDGIDRFT
ncbi:MAG: DUF421 domain-containing protein, partial [Methanobacteriota archaeon]